MQKIAYFLVILTLFLAAVPAVLAQTASPSSYMATVTPAVSGMIVSKSINSLMSRLGAALSRADKISQKTASRLVKLNLTNPRQATLTAQLNKLKEDFTKLNLQSQALNTSVFSKQDYLLFKNQVLVFVKNLKDVYSLETALVTDMKKAATVAATPTIYAAPTK